MARPRNKPAGLKARQALRDRLAGKLYEAMIGVVGFAGALSITGEFVQRGLRFVAVTGDWVQIANTAASLLALASGHASSFPTLPTTGGA